MTATPTPSTPDLANVLVVTYRKGFWASDACERFPHRLYGAVVRGHSSGLVNTAVLAPRLAWALLRRRPQVVLVGSAHRLAPPLLVLRRLRLLRARLVITNQVFFGPRWGRFADRVIVYSRAETIAGPSYVYLPIPADGDYAAIDPPTESSPYVFAGGTALRDFDSLVRGLDGAEVRLLIVTDRPEAVCGGAPPAWCDVRGRVPLQEFLSLMSGAALVVVPLRAGDDPHGHTTVAQALRLGKAVVTTRGASVTDYVRDGAEGLLVDPGDADGYRLAVTRLLGDPALRGSCEAAALGRAPEFTYEAFADAVASLCTALTPSPESTRSSNSA